MRRVGMILVAILVVVILLVSTVAFTVPSTEIVLVKTFGKTTSVYDGNVGEQAGLKFKWPYPIQRVVRYDARTFVFESPHAVVDRRSVDDHLDVSRQRNAVPPPVGDSDRRSLPFPLNEKVGGSSLHDLQGIPSPHFLDSILEDHGSAWFQAV